MDPLSADDTTPPPTYEKVGRDVVGYAIDFLQAVENLEAARQERLDQVVKSGKRVVEAVDTVGGTPVVRDHFTKEVIGRRPRS